MFLRMFKGWTQKTIINGQSLPSTRYQWYWWNKKNLWSIIKFTEVATFSFYFKQGPFLRIILKETEKKGIPLSPDHIVAAETISSL